MYKVEGFEFETKVQASAAKKEVEGIRYIKEHTCMEDPDTVLNLYNRLILKEVFSTPVGYAFLSELQSYLHSIPYIKREDILPIPVYRPEDIFEEANEEERRQRRERAKRDLASSKREILRKNKADQKERNKRERQAYFTARATAKNYRTPFFVSSFLALVFGLSLVGVFVIAALSNNNITILNYENTVIDKYEEWEASLNEREKRLKEWEASLELRDRNQSEE